MQNAAVYFSLMGPKTEKKSKRALRTTIDLLPHGRELWNELLGVIPSKRHLLTAALEVFRELDATEQLARVAIVSANSDEDRRAEFVRMFERMVTEADDDLRREYQKVLDSYEVAAAAAGPVGQTSLAGKRKPRRAQ